MLLSETFFPILKSRNKKVMKNTTTGYQTKESHHQPKEMAELKKIGHYITLLDISMKELKKIYWYEKELIIFIPILLSNASTFELVDSLTVLLNYTKEHVVLLEANFPTINKLNNPKIPYKTLPYKNIV